MHCSSNYYAKLSCIIYIVATNKLYLKPRFYIVDQLLISDLILHFVCYYMIYFPLMWEKQSPFMQISMKIINNFPVICRKV